MQTGALFTLVLLAACEGKAPAGLREGILDLQKIPAAGTLTATAASSSQIMLGWVDDARNETGWEIDRSTSGTNGRFDFVTSLGTDATAYNDDALAEATQYCYKVRSFVVVGRKTSYSAYTNAACATTAMNPPINVLARPESSTGILVSWVSGPRSPTGFRVERAAKSDGPWSIASTTSGTATSYHDTGRTSEQQACYRVIALAASGETAPSNVACTAPPAAPSNLMSTAASNAVTLSWQDHSVVEDGYQVQRSTDGVTFGVLASLSPSSVSYRDAAVVVAKTYTYRVAATRDGGRSDFSNALAVTVPSPQTDPPANAPANVVATPLSSSTMQIGWTDNTANESGFRVEQASSANGPWSAAATTAANVLSVTLTVPTDQRLCYRVIAFNANGESPPSTVDCDATLAAPTNLVATAASDGIDISWADNSSWEFGYQLEISTDGATFTDFQRLRANTTSFHHTGVQPTTTYWYRVRATRSGGLSEWSNSMMTAGACVPTSDTEDCSNGLDDNCDGAADGAEPACGELVDCNANPCGSGTICNGAYCVSSCDDGFRDSDEADVDCGGGCGPCQLDQLCWGSYDCASNNCVYAPGAFQGRCQPSTAVSARRLAPRAKSRPPATQKLLPLRRRP